MGILLENISLGYGSRTLVAGGTAKLPSGSLVALIGRNGTGKSTLLRAIATLDAPRGGTISLCGVPTSELTPRCLAATVSFVATDKVRIANLTASDVVALGRAPYTNWMGSMQAHDREIVAQALALVGMSDFADKTMDSISDGECQRIMIARALAQQTPLVLLDEPTAFLDLPNRYALAMLLRRLAHEERKCILFSTHDLDIALQLCDSVILIDTPHLHHMPSAELLQSGLIERLFAGESISFDPETQSIRLAK